MNRLKISQRHGFAFIFALCLVWLTLLVKPSAADTTNFLYLPIIVSHPPRVQSPLPQVTGQITLDNALCPNAIEYHPFTDSWYIGSHGSSDVTVLKNNAIVSTAYVGGRPTRIAVDTDSAHMWVTNLPTEVHTPLRDPRVDQMIAPNAQNSQRVPDPARVSVFNAGNLVKQVTPIHEPFDALYNPVNGYTYITDLDSGMMIYDGENEIARFRLEDDLGPAGWPLMMDYNPRTGEVYIPSFEYGTFFVVDGITMTAQTTYFGWGATAVAVHQQSGYIYIANASASLGPDGRRNNISVLNANSELVAQISTATTSDGVGIDQYTGLVYVTSRTDKTLTVLQGTEVIAVHNIPGDPTQVRVDSKSGYAYVPLYDKNQVWVLWEGQPVALLDAGVRPYDVGIDEASGTAWVINRHSFTYFDVEPDRILEGCMENPPVTVLQISTP